MSNETLNELLAKYKAGTCTEQEKALVEDWISHKSYPDYELSEAAMEEDLARITEAMPFYRKPRKLWPRIAAAASILLVCSAGGYFMLRQGPAANKPQQAESLLPATQGVTLTVAGHAPVQLAVHHHGTIKAGSQQIAQTDSLIAYSTATAKVEMQTLTNNSGYRMTLQLADGTEATLDVASSMTYPSAFTGKERRVTLNGQAYFKVRHDAAHPFFVDYQGQTTEDIGTEFNIQAYAGEKLVTTLINGSIRIGHRILKPGEQLVDDHVRVADIDAVTAWLQNKMILHGETLEHIMNHVARIYKVNIVWEDEASRKLTFGGMVNRSTKLSAILDFIRETGKADFRVEGKTIHVLKPMKKTK